MVLQKSTFLFLLLLLLCPPCFAQEASPSPITAQAISIKPTNFSNLDLGNNDGFPGYHFGLAYERLFCPSSHWAWVVPVTYAFYPTLLVTDYEKQGYQLYFTPGIKYYLKPNQPRKGWSASVNTLAGINRYHYSGSLRKGSIKEDFYGVFGSWIYNAPVGKTMAFNFELGFGLRYNHFVGSYVEMRDFPPYQADGTIDNRRFSGMMNFSVGISKWF